MGGKHSKREGAYGSTPPRGSPSSKVARSRSLPTRIFARRLTYEHGGSFRGRPLPEEFEDPDHLDEYRRLIELERSHGKENAGFCGGTSHDVIRSCISPRRGSKEEVIYEEEDHDNVADASGLEDEVEGLRDSPPFARVVGRSRLSSYSAPCLAALVGKDEALDRLDLIQEALLVDPSLSGNASPVAEKPEEAGIQLADSTNSLKSEEQSGETKCKASDQCLLQPSTEPAVKFVNIEEKELTSSNKASLPPEAELPCEEIDLHVCEGQQRTPLENDIVTDGEEDQGRGAETDWEGPEEYCSEASSVNSVLEWGSDYKFQAQKSPKRPRFRRNRRRHSCDQVQDRAGSDEAGNMSGKGKVSLAFNSAGKRQKDMRKNSFTDGRDVVWGTAPGKRMKDRDGGEESAPSDIHPDAFAWGLMGQSDPFLGVDAAGFFSQLPVEEDQMKGGFTRRSRTPSKASRGRALARKVRGLRASPKPVSSLESCLRAQLDDESDRDRARRVSRPLNFSSPADGSGKYEDVNMIGYINGVPSLRDKSPVRTGMVKAEEGTPKARLTPGSTGSVKLPNLQDLIKGYAAKLAASKDERGSASDVKLAQDVANDQTAGSAADGWWKKALLPVVLKKRKISDVRQVLSTGSETAINKVKTKDVGSMEGLLFGFGVGIGMLSVANTSNFEVVRLQAQVQNLKLELERRGGPTVLHSAGAGDKVDKTSEVKGAGKILAGVSGARDEAAGDKLESVRSRVTLGGSLQQGDQMAELEAELEAELDQLTGGDSATMESRYSVLDELDMDGFASVVHGDLTVNGLPARVEESSDDDDYSAPAQPACLNNYAVSPRELTRLLRKLQATRQAQLLIELEEELDAVQSKLQSKEKELDLWKDRVRRLTEVSFASASGDECLTPHTPTGAVAPFERSSTPSNKNMEVNTAERSIDAIEGPGILHFPMQGVGELANCSLSDTDAAGSEYSDGPIPVTLGQVETMDDSHTDAAEQKPRDIGRENPRRNNPSAGADVCNEFLWSMIDDEVEVSLQAELAAQNAKDCRPVMDNAQIEKQLIDSVREMETPDFTESSDMGSASPSVCGYSSAVSMADAWDHSLGPAAFRTNNGDTGIWVRRAKLLVPHPSRRTSWNSEVGNPILIREPGNKEPLSAKADSCTAHAKHAEPQGSSKSVSEISDAETVEYKTSDTPCSVKHIDKRAKPAPECAVPAELRNPLQREGVGRAGLNTPVEKVRQQLFKAPMESQPNQHPLFSDRRPGELSPTVLDKISRWEGLMEGETPGPPTGSDWECLSRASEAEQQCTLDSVYDDINIFGEENLVSEAEEMLGRMLINRIVEKTRRGSHIVKEAQTALATLERDDSGAGGDIHTVEEAEMNGREGSDAPTPSEQDSDSRQGWSDDQEKMPPSFLDEAVREEYKFFRRLELINRDRKAAKGVKGKAAREPVYLGRLDIESIPELDLGANSQFSQGSESYGVKDDGGVVGRDQAEESAKERSEKGSSDSKNRGRDNWLVCGDARLEPYGGNGYREDEAWSRRWL